METSPLIIQDTWCSAAAPFSPPLHRVSVLRAGSQEVSELLMGRVAFVERKEKIGD